MNPLPTLIENTKAKVADYAKTAVFASVFGIPGYFIGHGNFSNYGSELNTKTIIACAQNKYIKCKTLNEELEQEHTRLKYLNKGFGLLGLALGLGLGATIYRREKEISELQSELHDYKTKFNQTREAYDVVAGRYNEQIDIIQGFERETDLFYGDILDRNKQRENAEFPISFELSRAYEKEDLDDAVEAEVIDIFTRKRE